MHNGCVYIGRHHISLHRPDNAAGDGLDRPLLLAPMASVSEMPYRVMCLEMGAALATTELVSASGIKYKNRRTKQYMTFDRVKERPYSLQLFGGAPDVMAEAALAGMEHGADIIDINMGCPVKKVTGTGAGSALSCDPPRAASLVEAMRKAVGDKIPITCKIRSGWDANTINAVEMAKTLEGAGCAALAIHARTRAAGYSGVADWTVLASVKRAVKMPIIGNGDVVSIADARRMVAETNVDAVMIGRGALGNPWIFRGAASGKDLPPPTAAERLSLILRHYTDHIAFHEILDDEEQRRLLHTAPVVMATKTFRQHLVWYSRGLVGGKEFRKEVLTIEDPDVVKALITRFFGAAEADVAPAYGEDQSSDDPDGVNYQQAFG